MEVSWEENGMEVTVGELRAPTFYFINETKFWKQVQQLLKSQIQCFHITLVNFRQRTQALSRGLARGGFQGTPLLNQGTHSPIVNSDFIPAKCNGLSITEILRFVLC